MAISNPIPTQITGVFKTQNAVDGTDLPASRALICCATACKKIAETNGKMKGK
jgi:hypothetical protein